LFLGGSENESFGAGVADGCTITTLDVRRIWSFGEIIIAKKKKTVTD